MLDPKSGVMIGICDCDKGFYGIDFCEPISDFIRLPVINSLAATAKIIDSRIVGGETVVVPFSSPRAGLAQVSQNAVQLQCSIPISSPAMVWNVTIPVVQSVFKAFLGPTDRWIRDDPQVVVLDASQRQRVSRRVLVNSNPNAPSKLIYTVSNSDALSGLSVKAATSGFDIAGPLSPQSGSFTFHVTATDSFSRESLVVANVTLNVQDCGTDTCSNGGKCVDTDGDPYNGNFTCECTSLFTGIRCDEIVSNSTSSVRELTTSSGVSAAVYGGIAAAMAVLLLALIIVLVRHYKRKHAPHDFSSMLETVDGLNASDHHGPKVPREIKRSAVRIVHNLGKGNFGTVDKAILDEHHLLGAGYLVACKQLLSTRNEDRLSLLEESVVMAQFDNPHCVRLIGVVTAGNPVLVC